MKNTKHDLLKIIFLSFVMALFLPGFASEACDLYVSTTGTDNLSCGDQSSSCRHIEYAVEQRAVSGQTVCVNDGTYNEAQLTVPAGVSLTSTSQDKTKVIIQPNTNLDPWHPFINLSSASPGSAGDQTISYLTFDGETGTYYARRGIFIQNRNDIKVTQCNIKDFTGQNGSCGVYVISTEIGTTTAWWDYWPEDPQAPGVETNIEVLWPVNPVENFELSYCTINNCGYKASIDGPGIKYPAVKPFNLKNSSIHHNTINTEASYGQPIKCVCAFFDNVDIYDNTLTMAYYTGDASPGNAMSSYAIELWALRRGCEFYNNTSNGMFSITVGKETKIYANEIVADGLQNDGGTGIEYLYQCEGEVYGNYIENAGSRGIILGLPAGTSNSYKIQNVNVYNNIIYNAYYQAIRVICLNSRSGTFLVDSINVYNNTVDTIRIGGSTQKLLHAYRTNTGGGSSTLSNVSFVNNICVNSTGYAGKTSGTVASIEIDHNLFYFNGTDDWLDGTDTNSIADNPDVNGTGDKPSPWYYLQAVSPCVDAGVDVGLPFSGSAPDIGAYEYGVGAKSSPPTNVRMKIIP